MKATLKRFGVLEIDGVEYHHDVVIDRGKVRHRDSAPSKSVKGWVGHTPLSIHEEIPWDCKRLLIGNGAYGRLPVMEEVHGEARKRGVRLTIDRTKAICRLLSRDPENTSAILHCTC